MRNIDARHTIALITAGAILAVADFAPAAPPAHRQLPVLAPWRPSLSVRFSGAMTAFDQPVATAADSHGFVALTVAGVPASQLEDLSSAATRAADRVSRSCGCDLHGYRVLARVPGRGVQVVASSTPSG